MARNPIGAHSTALRRKFSPVIAALLLIVTHIDDAVSAKAFPIRHLVIIFQENHSFDSYFGTYPDALNPSGVPQFHARPGTPPVNGLNETLLEHNPNESNPFRIARIDALTCSQDHDYTDEQRARNGGLMNRYVRYAARGPWHERDFCHKNEHGNWDTALGYFDGNTVTALWNYAQHFAMSDNSFATSSGESTRGALNLVSGDTYGVLCGPKGKIIGEVPSCGEAVSSTEIDAPAATRPGTFNIDADPYWDVCSRGETSALTGRNVGDLLNAAGITWGWFQGGFSLSGDGACASSHPQIAFDRATGADPDTDESRVRDYVPHHNPFQYFASTANPAHLEPASLAHVGKTDRANHNYDLSWFWLALEHGELPTISFLKAPAYQNGHPGYSNPLDEQAFLVDTLNRLQRSRHWETMAVIIAWDDSDGWYDHVMPPIVNRSSTPKDYRCGEVSDGPGGRCGYGPRLPLLVISPYARENYVSGRLTDQTSILRFIEDHWLGGERMSDISFDRLAGSLEDMFDFAEPRMRRLYLDRWSGTVIDEASVAVN